jgi:hypothetical protein
MIIIVAARLVALQISSVPPNFDGYSFIGQILRMIVLTCGHPLLFAVAHVVYLGPIILLMVFYWRTISHTVLGHGPGAMLFVAAAICISLNPASRYLSPVYPFLVAMTAQALDKVQLSRSFYVFFAVASFIVSKAWLRIDPGRSDNGFGESYLEFPWQWYFMNHGPEMSASMYLVQGTLIVAIAVAMWQLLPRAAARTAEGPRS